MKVCPVTSEKKIKQNFFLKFNYAAKNLKI